jgi:hypothetical protein
LQRVTGRAEYIHRWRFANLDTTYLRRAVAVPQPVAADSFNFVEDHSD